MRGSLGLITIRDIPIVFTSMPTEGFIGMSYIMVAFLIANLAVLRLLKPSWRAGEKTDQYLAAQTPAYFLIAGTGMFLFVAVFLSGLISLFATTSTDAAPITYGMAQEEAAKLFYLVSLATLAISGIGMFKYWKSVAAETDKRLIAQRFVGGSFASFGPMNCLLLTLLVAFATTTTTNADYVLAGQFVLIGSVLGAVTTLPLRRWFEGVQQESTLDGAALESTAKRRFFVTAIAAGVPTAYGLYLLIL